MGLLSGLLLILTNIFVTALQVQLRSETISALQQDSDYVIQRLQYDVYRADSVTLPADIGDESTTLTLSIDSEDWTYAESDGQLVLSNTSGDVLLHSDRIQMTDFVVSRVGNPGGEDWIQVTFTMMSTIVSSAQERERTFTTTIGVR